MFTFLSDFLQKNHIVTFAPLPLSDCKLLRPYLLERTGITAGTVVMIAVPYYTHACDAPDRNLSAYAVGRDYHLFFSNLFTKLLPLLRKNFPNNRFAGFADHSPIDEIDAAARAGLGVIGDNGLLLTTPYSSYVFLGEVITDMPTSQKAREPLHCESCGACRAACPAKGVDCLSALTQKKAALTDKEEAALRNFDSVWGCDVCQEVCPYTRRARVAGTLYTPVPFFWEEALPHVDLSTLARISDSEFLTRAYSWRGPDIITRNIERRMKGEKTC